MKRIRAIATACICATFAPAPGFAQSRPPVEAFGQLPDIDSAQLSPDGQHFAVVQSYNGKPAAVIYRTVAAPDNKPFVVPSEEWLVRSVKWVKNDRLVVILGEDTNLPGEESRDFHSWKRAVSIGADGTGLTLLLQNVPWIGINYGAANIVDLDLSDPDNIYMPLWTYSNMRSSFQQEKDAKIGTDMSAELFTNDLFRVDVKTGKGTRASSGGHYTYDWFLDGHGRIVARVDETERPLRDHLLLYDNGNWHETGVFDAEADRGAGVRGLTDDGKALAVLTRDAQSMQTLMRRDLVSGKEEYLFGNPAFDVDDAIVDEWTNRVVGATFEADARTNVYFDPQRQALQRGLERAFPGSSVAALSIDAAQDKVIVVAEGPRSPPAYYILDRTTHQATQIASAYPDLNEADLGQMKPYPYKARDGLAIPAYLTLPPGRDAKNLPVVVMPHGGPDARDSIGFDWWAQFLANRGYAVLQPNYRGSSGYGHKFTEAGLHQWGLKMQDDITDGVRQMIADGVADPKRVCIVGASYGGYAALAGAAFTPDLYACAVSVAGVSDLPRMILEDRGRYGKDSSTMSFWISRIGSPDDDSDQLRATSPARHADQVKCPVLLIHNEKDTTVPIVQSALMFDALKSAGKNVRMVTLEGDDHYLRLAASRIRMLSELEKFLAANIGTAVQK